MADEVTVLGEIVKVVGGLLLGGTAVVGHQRMRARRHGPREARPAAHPPFGGHNNE